MAETNEQPSNETESGTLLEFDDRTVKTAWNCLKCFPKICRCDDKHESHFAQGCGYASNYSSDSNQPEERSDDRF